MSFIIYDVAVDLYLQGQRGAGEVDYDIKIRIRRSRNPAALYFINSLISRRATHNRPYFFGLNFHTERIFSSCFRRLGFKATVFKLGDAAKQILSHSAVP